MLKPGRWLSVARARCLPYTLIATLSAVALGPSSGLACSCLLSSPTDALDHATQVFSGRVTAWEDPYAGDIIQDSLDPVTITLAVERVWKGDVGPMVQVKTARDGSSCGFKFQKGEQYLVYAYNSAVSSVAGRRCSPAPPRISLRSTRDTSPHARRRRRAQA